MLRRSEPLVSAGALPSDARPAPHPLCNHLPARPLEPCPDLAGADEQPPDGNVEREEQHRHEQQRRPEVDGRALRLPVVPKHRRLGPPQGRIAERRVEPAAGRLRQPHQERHVRLQVAVLGRIGDRRADGVDSLQPIRVPVSEADHVLPLLGSVERRLVAAGRHLVHSQVHRVVL